MPYAGTSDVAESAKGDSSTIRNGSVVVGVRPHGSYTSDTTRSTGGPTPAQMQTKFISSFDDPKYYGSRSSLLTGLLSWYKFNESSGSVRANSITDDLSLTDNNTVAKSSGLIENGASFIDANNEYFSIASGSANSMGNASSFSLSVWLKLTSTSSNQDIVEMWDTGQRKFYLMYYAGSTNLRYYTSNNGSASTYVTSGLTTISSGTWYNIIITSSGSDRRLYLNNADVTTGTSGVTIASTSTSSFTVGGAGVLGGTISELAYWTKVLSSDERASVYNSGAGITYPGF